MIVKYGEVYEKALVIEDALGILKDRLQQRKRSSGQGGSGGARPSTGSPKKPRIAAPLQQD